MTILPLSFSPLFFHSIFIFPSKNHLSLSILLPPPSLHLAPTHGHGQSLPPPPASSSLLASCSDTRAQAAAARPPTVPCRGTVSWCCSDPAVLRCGTGFRHRSAARAERSPRGGAQHASGGQRRHARWSRRRSHVELQFLALCPPSCSGHRVFRGFVAGVGVETELKHHLLGLLEKPVLELFKKPSQTAGRKLLHACRSSRCRRISFFHRSILISILIYKFFRSKCNIQK